MELFAEFNDGLRIYYYDNRRFRVFKRGNNIFISDIDNSFQYCKNGNVVVRISKNPVFIIPYRFLGATRFFDVCKIVGVGNELLVETNGYFSKTSLLMHPLKHISMIIQDELENMFFNIHLDYLEIDSRERLANICQRLERLVM